MKDIEERISQFDWEEITESLHTKGFGKIGEFLTEAECDELSRLYNQETLFRKTVVMERHRFGLGEYKYFNYPLPNLLHSIRSSIYEKLAPIANAWMRALKIEMEYPTNLDQFHEQCKQMNQNKPTVLILKYREGGFNTLHQDLYGELYFPIQLVLFLSEPEKDYSGGQFVMTEQIPRAQSKAIVLQPKKGDAVLIATSFRPVRGNKGYYRANMRHGVSEVHSGNRSTVGIIFHDALN